MNELNYKKRFHLFKDMKFLHRMILIYLIGGIIPLLVMSIYTNMQTRKMMIKLTEELKEHFDYVLLDCPAGIEQGFPQSVSL